MRRIALALGILVASITPTFAGQIEIGGQWRSFDSLILPGGPIRTYVRDSGLVAKTGKVDVLLKNEARILLLTGKRWSTYRFIHFEKRFWPLSNPTLTLKDWGMNSHVTVDHELVPPYEKEEAWYAFDIRFNGPDTEQVLAKFRTISEIADAENDDFKFKHCIEMRGKISWASLGSDSINGKRLVRYVLLVDSVREAGLIPAGYLSDMPPVPNLEDATKMCPSQN